VKILIFGGTTEGRELAAALAVAGFDVTLSVATEYGADIADGDANIAQKATVLSGRLSKDEMVELISRGSFDYIIDATHPYATLVTDNIKAAADEGRQRYLRLERLQSEVSEDVIFVEDTAAAVKLLNDNDENVLLTTGSKDLEIFAKGRDYSTRFYPRILPMEDSLEHAIQLGYRGANIICMQGPFSIEMNIATLKKANAKYLVTKDSGVVGGVVEKIAAAKSAECKVVLISRPPSEKGYTYDEMLNLFGIADDAGEAGEVSGVSEASGADAKSEASQAGEAGANSFFPLFVDMENKKVLVIGAGNIAERRVKTLQSFGASIIVIAPKASEYIKSEAKDNKLLLVEREYQKGDIAEINPFIVLTATDNRQTNNDAMIEASSQNIFISVADQRDECTFYFPAIMENENYVMGLVSKDGNHAGVRELAQKIRDMFL